MLDIHQVKACGSFIMKIKVSQAYYFQFLLIAEKKTQARDINNKRALKDVLNENEIIKM